MLRQIKAFGLHGYIRKNLWSDIVMGKAFIISSYLASPEPEKLAEYAGPLVLR